MVKGILINRRAEEAAALRTQLKMEHTDLIAEMQTIENLPTHERLQLARIRRAQQLKVARQKEKEWIKLERVKGNSGIVFSTNGGGPVGNRMLPQNGDSTKMEYSNRTNCLKENMGVLNNGRRRNISFENSVVLLEAASRNDMQEVADLLKAGITPDAANEDGLTALHQCCIDNNVDMLKLLLEYGANVDAQDSDKWTPLHAAATCGHMELVRILIDNGANLLAVNTDGNMPYDLCDDETTLDFIEAEMSKRGVTQELIDETRSATEVKMLNDLMEVARNGGDLEEPDHQGATPLHIASANGYVRVVEFLLEMHVNVDAADNDLWTPVHAAACWGHLEVLEMLSQSGAVLNVKNKDNETPSDICEDPEIRERIEQLKTEQESKRLAEAQRRRVRRSQSNNTRAQSVRRTSLRDKTLTTKKDAVEEARLRLQAQEVFTVSNKNAVLESKSSIDVGTQPASIQASLSDMKTTNTTTQSSTTTTSSSSSSSSPSLHSSTTPSKSLNDTINLATNATATSHKHLQNQTAIQPTLNNNNNNNNNSGSNNNFLSNNNYNMNNNKNNNNYNTNTNINNYTQYKNMSNVASGAGGMNNGDSNGIGDMKLTRDVVDSNNSRIKVFLPRRPPDGRDEYDEDHNLLLNGSFKQKQQKVQQQCTETVKIQSCKEANNGKINVQVTVLVDTTQHVSQQQPVAAKESTQEYQQQQQEQQQQQQQQQQTNINSSSSNFINTLSTTTTTNTTTTTSSIINNNNSSNKNNSNQLLLLLPLSGATTLANLKKQRSLSRTNILNSSSENGSVVDAASSAGLGQMADDAFGVDTQYDSSGLSNHANYNNKSNNNNHKKESKIISQQINNNNNKNNMSFNSNNHNVLTTRTTETTTTTINSMGNTTLKINKSENMALPSTHMVDFQTVPSSNSSPSPTSSTQNNNSNSFAASLTSSAVGNITKFSGIPGDVVSDSTNSQRCCILM